MGNLTGTHRVSWGKETKTNCTVGCFKLSKSMQMRALQKAKIVSFLKSGSTQLWPHVGTYFGNVLCPCALPNYTKKFLGIWEKGLKTYNSRCLRLRVGIGDGKEQEFEGTEKNQKKMNDWPTNLDLFPLKIRETISCSFHHFLIKKKLIIKKLW